MTVYRKIWILILLLLSASSVWASVQSKHDLLFGKVTEQIALRASLMKEVAAIKYNAKDKGGVSLYDAAQEVAVLKNIADMSATWQLSKTALLLFAQVQMDMAKQIQEYWFNVWKAQKKSHIKTPYSLVKIREKIKAVNETLYPDIAEVSPFIQSYTDQQIEAMLQSAFIKADVTEPEALNLFYKMLAAALGAFHIIVS